MRRRKLVTPALLPRTLQAADISGGHVSGIQLLRDYASYINS
jgi:hypothetical protein